MKNREVQRNMTTTYVFIVSKTIPYEGQIGDESVHITEAGALKKFDALVTEIDARSDTPDQWDIQRTDDRMIYYNGVINVVMKKRPLHD